MITIMYKTTLNFYLVKIKTKSAFITADEVVIFAESGVITK